MHALVFGTPLIHKPKKQNKARKPGDKARCDHHKNIHERRMYCQSLTEVYFKLYSKSNNGILLLSSRTFILSTVDWPLPLL